MKPSIEKSHSENSQSGMIYRVVEKIIHHSPEIFEIHLSRNNEQFIPGQYLSLGTDQPEVSREYSIASGINEPWLGFIIRHRAGGQVTEFLSRLQPREVIHTSWPSGTFRPGFQPGKNQFIFIATGTGIAPFLSYLKSYPQKPPLSLLYGVRFLRDAVGLSDLEKNFPIQLAISREKISGQHHGRVTDILHTLPLQKNIHYYLCGLDAMIQQVSEWFQYRGIPSDHIHYEGNIPTPSRIK